MGLSLGRFKPAFRLYARPRMNLKLFARFQGGRPSAGLQQPRVFPRAYVNPKPRVGFYEWMKWPPGNKNK